MIFHATPSRCVSRLSPRLYPQPPRHCSNDDDAKTRDHCDLPCLRSRDHRDSPDRSAEQVEKQEPLPATAAIKVQRAQREQITDYSAGYRNVQETRRLQGVWGCVPRRDDAEAYRAREVDLGKPVSTAGYIPA